MSVAWSKPGPSPARRSSAVLISAFCDGVAARSRIARALENAEAGQELALRHRSVHCGARALRGAREAGEIDVRREVGLAGVGQWIDELWARTACSVSPRAGSL